MTVLQLVMQPLFMLVAGIVWVPRARRDAARKTKVMLELDERAMNPLIDKFGLEALIFKREGGKIYASVKAPLSPQFFGWLLQLGPMIKIESPKAAREMCLEQLRSALGAYGEAAEGA